MIAQYLPSYSEYKDIDRQGVDLDQIYDDDGEVVDFENADPATQSFIYHQNLMTNLVDDGVDDVTNYTPDNLTSVALTEASFEGVLRIFARDGHRLRRLRHADTLSRDLAWIADTRYQVLFEGMFSSILAFDPKEALLILLCFAAQPLEIYSRCGSGILTQLYSLAGGRFDLGSQLSDYTEAFTGKLEEGRLHGFRQSKKIDDLRLVGEIITDRLVVQRSPALPRWTLLLRELKMLVQSKYSSADARLKGCAMILDLQAHRIGRGDLYDGEEAFLEAHQRLLQRYYQLGGPLRE